MQDEGHTGAKGRRRPRVTMTAFRLKTPKTVVRARLARARTPLVLSRPDYGALVQAISESPSPNPGLQDLVAFARDNLAE